MILRGINFGRVWGASGVQGFFGEGYWYHRYLEPLGLDFAGATFVAKTTTVPPRAGNMPLNPDWTPRDRLPDCIRVYPFRGIALNAVGLSGPGFKTLLDTWRWQRRTVPFFISFMALGSLPEKLQQVDQFISILESRLGEFWSPFGIQVNLTCPNAGMPSDDLVQEAFTTLNFLARLELPLVLKLVVTTHPEDAVVIARHPACDAICVSNTVPFGKLERQINWDNLIGKQSPLHYLGGGGLSGKPLLPLLVQWLRETRSAGLKKPINGGGGILSSGDAQRVLDAGANGISLGSIAFLRPWRVAGIVKKFS